MKILLKERTDTQTSFPTNFGGKNWVWFFLSACTGGATYIFNAAATGTTIIITLEPCAVNAAEFQHFIFNKIFLTLRITVVFEGFEHLIG
jgi:hypothetical protein